MRIAELEISGYIEFEGTNYCYWNFEVDDIVVKVAELALQKALLPNYPETKYKNLTAEFVAHNHPSGDPTPSTQDAELTRKLVEVSRIMAIPLLDHIIVGAVDSADGKGFISMRENGAVEF